MEICNKWVISLHETSCRGSPAQRSKTQEFSMTHIIPLLQQRSLHHVLKPATRKICLTNQTKHLSENQSSSWDVQVTTDEMRWLKKKKTETFSHKFTSEHLLKQALGLRWCKHKSISVVRTPWLFWRGSSPPPPALQQRRPHRQPGWRISPDSWKDGRTKAGRERNQKHTRF